MQLQTLITEIEAILGKATPRLPWVVAGDANQQRRVLEQARNYLQSLQTAAEAPGGWGPLSPETGEIVAELIDPQTIAQQPEATSQQVLQALLQEMQYLRSQTIQPLRTEVSALQQQREQLAQEVRQLELERLRLAGSAPPPLLNPALVDEVVQRLQDTLLGQITPQIQSLQAQVNDPASFYGAGIPESNGLETPNDLPQLQPQQRLEQLRRIQAQTDYMLLRLDTNLRSVFESMEQSIQSYRDSLHQGLDTMHGLGQQGEVIFKALVNHLAQQLGQEHYLDVPIRSSDDDSPFDRRTARLSAAADRRPAYDADTADRRDRFQEDSNDSSSYDISSPFPNDDLDLDDLDLDALDADFDMGRDEEITLFQLDEEITQLQLDDRDPLAEDYDDDVTAFQGEGDATIIQMEPIPWAVAIGQVQGKTPGVEDDSDRVGETATERPENYAELDALYESLFGNTEESGGSEAEGNLDSETPVDSESEIDAAEMAADDPGDTTDTTNAAAVPEPDAALGLALDEALLGAAPGIPPTPEDGVLPEITLDLGETIAPEEAIEATDEVSQAMNWGIAEEENANASTASTDVTVEPQAEAADPDLGVALDDDGATPDSFIGFIGTENFLIEAGPTTSPAEADPPAEANTLADWLFEGAEERLGNTISEEESLLGLEGAIAKDQSEVIPADPIQDSALASEATTESGPTLAALFGEEGAVDLQSSPPPSLESNTINSLAELLPTPGATAGLRSPGSPLDHESSEDRFIAAPPDEDLLAIDAADSAWSPDLNLPESTLDQLNADLLNLEGLSSEDLSLDNSRDWLLDPEMATPEIEAISPSELPTSEAEYTLASDTDSGFLSNFDSMFESSDTPAITEATPDPITAPEPPLDSEFDLDLASMFDADTDSDPDLESPPAPASITALDLDPESPSAPEPIGDLESEPDSVTVIEPDVETESLVDWASAFEMGPEEMDPEEMDPEADEDEDGLLNLVPDSQTSASLFDLEDEFFQDSAMGSDELAEGTSESGTPERDIALELEAEVELGLASIFNGADTADTPDAEVESALASLSNLESIVDESADPEENPPPEGSVETLADWFDQDPSPTPVFGTGVWETPEPENPNLDLDSLISDEDLSSPTLESNLFDQDLSIPDSIAEDLVGAEEITPNLDLEAWGTYPVEPEVFEADLLVSDLGEPDSREPDSTASQGEESETGKSDLSVVETREPEAGELEAPKSDPQVLDSLGAEGGQADVGGADDLFQPEARETNADESDDPGFDDLASILNDIDLSSIPNPPPSEPEIDSWEALAGTFDNFEAEEPEPTRSQNDDFNLSLEGISFDLDTPSSEVSSSQAVDVPSSLSSAGLLGELLSDLSSNPMVEPPPPSVEFGLDQFSSSLGGELDLDGTVNDNDDGADTDTLPVFNLEALDSMLGVAPRSDDESRTDGGDRGGEADPLATLSLDGFGAALDLGSEDLGSEDSLGATLDAFSLGEDEGEESLDTFSLGDLDLNLNLDLEPNQPHPSDQEILDSGLVTLEDSSVYPFSRESLESDREAIADTTDATDSPSDAPEPGPPADLEEIELFPATISDTGTIDDNLNISEGDLLNLFPPSMVPPPSAPASELGNDALGATDPSPEDSLSPDILEALAALEQMEDGLEESFASIAVPDVSDPNVSDLPEPISDFSESSSESSEDAAAALTLEDVLGGDEIDLVLPELPVSLGLATGTDLEIDPVISPDVSTAPAENRELAGRNPGEEATASEPPALAFDDLAFAPEEMDLLATLGSPTNTDTFATGAALLAMVRDRTQGAIADPADAEPPDAGDSAAEDSEWFLGLDLGSTGLSAVLMDRIDGKAYPLYWTDTGLAGATAETIFRLPAVASIAPSTWELQAVGAAALTLTWQGSTEDETPILLNQIKPLLATGMPHQDGAGNSQPLIQWSDRQVIPLKQVWAAVQALLTTIQANLGTAIAAPIGAAGLTLPEMGIALTHLQGVIVGYPASGSDTYRINVREAVLAAQLVSEASQVFFVDDAIAAVLSGLPDPSAPPEAAISQSQTLYQCNWQGGTVIISAGATVTELGLVDLPYPLGALSSDDFTLRTLAYGGDALDLDIISQLLSPKERRQSRPLGSNRRNSSGWHWQATLPETADARWESLGLEELTLPRLAEPDGDVRVQLRRRLESSPLGQSLLEAARHLKLILQNQAQFHLELGDQSWRVLRRDLESRILVPYIQRINQNLNGLMSQTGLSSQSIKQVICTGGNASFATIAKWLRQKFPNATIIQDTYPIEHPTSCSRVAYGLVNLCRYPQVLDGPRHQYSDYFLLQEILRIIPDQPLPLSGLLHLLEEQGINTEVCQQRIIALLEGQLPPGLGLDGATRSHLSGATLDTNLYRALASEALFNHQSGQIYVLNAPHRQRLLQHLATLMAHKHQSLTDPLMAQLVLP